MKPVTLLLLILTLYNRTQAQDKTFVGVNVNSSFESLQNDVWLGATFSMQLTKRSGFETGIYYRRDKYYSNIFVQDSSGFRNYYTRFSVSYLIIPVLYKFHTKLIDIAAGPYFDYYMGWRLNKNSSPEVTTNVNVGRKLRIRWMAKVSRDFSLGNNLYLEPEIRYSEYQWLGFGAGLKYRL